MRQLKAELLELAEQGGGVILAEDLIRRGLDVVERATAIRALHRLRRGAYTIAAPANARTRHRLLLRAVLRQSAGPCVGSYVSAAVLHDLPVPGEYLATVHLTSGAVHARPGVRHGVHTHVAPQKQAASPPVMVDGLAVTPAAITVVDCARMLPVVEAVALADSALNRRLTDPRAIARVCARSRGRPGIASARRAMALTDGGAESVGETRTRLVLIHAGFEVESQVELCDSVGRFVARVDLKLRDAPVVVEFDGRAKYSLDGDAESAAWREKMRHDRIGNLGYERVRVWWNRLADPAGIVRDVAQARDRALGRTGPT